MADITTIDDETALSTAINVLRESVESGRMPSGQKLEPEVAALHAQAIAHLDELRRHRSETDFRALVDAMPIHVWTSRADGSGVFFNRRRLEYTGTGVDWYGIVHPDERVDHDAAWHTAVRTGQPFHYEQRLVAADGSARWFLGRAETVRDQDGNVVGWVGINIDIEDRKRAEQVQADAERQLKTVIDTIPAHVWRAGLDGENDFINQARVEFGGSNLSWQELVHPDDVAVHRRNREAAQKTGQPFEQEMRLLRKDGTYRWFLVRAAPQRNDDGTVSQWFGTNTDIDDLKQAQERVRRSEQDLRDTIDTIPAHIWSCLPDGTSDYVNRRRVEYTGPDMDHLDIVHPDDRAKHDEKWTTSLRTGRAFEIENRLRGFDGTYRRFLGRAAPLRDEHGNISRWYGTNTDIEDLRQTEDALRRAQAELTHVSRISTLGELVASIAHEVNQPLAGIITNGAACLRWLRHEPPNLDEVRQAVERIIGDGQRAAQVVERLRALARKEESDRRPLNLNELVAESLPLVARELSHGRIKVDLSLAPHLPEIMADRVQVQQVLINLLINGIQAMAETTEGERVLGISSRLDEADGVMLAVRDSGPGIDPAAEDRLFKPFVTTKPNGMGMGLSICRSIVEAHGGRIWANSDAAPGKKRGADFRFTLPVRADTSGP
ncbi:MAG TPA: PAS domain-containing protein [Acetobacteraceae bacterium]|jgi:PAS domain S-box-containing protein|nr:PAS domain-containing protein [Acetobacteraceae bacterium]